MNDNEKSVQATNTFWVVVLLILPPVAVVAGMIYIFRGRVDFISFFLLILFYVLTVLGITVGFHRCFTHRAFVIKKPWLKWVLAVLGSMAIEGPLMMWVGQHRNHHSTTDKEGDPHSPHRFGAGFWNVFKGWWHAHIVWMINPPSIRESRVRDLLNDSILARVNRQFVFWAVAGLFIPAIVGVALRGGNLSYFWIDFLWSGLIRVFLVHQVTWSINSACHLWGSRPFDIDDLSTNNPVFGILGLGEGHHQCHHFDERSAKHGLLKGQFDFSWQVIQLLYKFDLIEKPYVTSPEKIEKGLKK